jgi:hypothetical protein
VVWIYRTAATTINVHHRYLGLAGIFSSSNIHAEHSVIEFCMYIKIGYRPPMPLKSRRINTSGDDIVICTSLSRYTPLERSGGLASPSNAKTLLTTVRIFAVTA